MDLVMVVTTPQLLLLNSSFVRMQLGLSPATKMAASSLNLNPPRPHLVLLLSPGMGHFIPGIELAKRLATLHHLHLTIFTLTSPANSQITHAHRQLYHLIELPPPDVSALLPPGATVITQLCFLMREIRPALRSALSRLHPLPSLLIVDLFGTESLSIADELNIPKLVFIASNAWYLALSIYSPTLHEMVDGEYIDHKDPFDIPGCGPIRPEDLVDPMLHRTDHEYQEYLRLCVETSTSNGVLVNTWEELQPKHLSALRDEALLGRFIKVPIFPIGPISRSPGRPDQSNEQVLFNWLDKQPHDSVVYVSFGSGGMLSWEQMTEVALGMELAKQRFVWVVRPPAAKKDGSFFTAGSKSEARVAEYLPEGFVERTREMGIVVAEWASQVEILNHPSVGGFLTHCGWNSVLEAISGGVAMIAWPLYAEQRMNATMLTEEMQIAVRRKVLPEKELVGKDEIAAMVGRIMADEEGEKMRGRVREMKQSGERAWEQTGSSYKALSNFVALLTYNEVKC